MGRPRIFLHLVDDTLKKQFLDRQLVRKFEVFNSTKQTPWIEQPDLKTSDVAIVEADDFSEQDLQFLLKSNLLFLNEFIFISHGRPNPFLDAAMRSGAVYHFRTPLNTDTIENMLKDYLEYYAVDIRSTERSVSSNLDQCGLLVGSSPPILSLYRTIRKVALTTLNILISGESGVGKELVATTLHLLSSRSSGPFVAINCGALSNELVDSELFGHVKGAFTGAHKDHQGDFEQAEGGTLFLDEITEMPIDHQVKLLRVLESSEYRPVGSNKVKYANARIIAATNRDPLQAIAEKVLREDLYFRLAQFPIAVPPLRERSTDIVGLANHFLSYRNAKEKRNKHFSADTLAKIERHSWPGNVRELKHAIERAYLLANGVIRPENLILDSAEFNCPESTFTSISPGMSLHSLEKAAILNTLQCNDGNKTNSAHQLGISVKTLYNKLEKYQAEE